MEQPRECSSASIRGLHISIFEMVFDTRIWDGRSQAARVQPGGYFQHRLEVFSNLLPGSARRQDGQRDGEESMQGMLLPEL
jgi:hypothetical protein